MNTPPAIIWNRISKSFGQVQAINDLSLEIPAGQVTALLGPNGAGKSTLLDITLDLLQPDHGSTQIFGMSPRQALRAGNVGAVLQNGSLGEDVFTPRKLITAFASLWENSLPVGHLLSLTQLEKIADQKLRKLSGGQLQRVRLALSLVNNPALLILDEPTTGLDVNSRQEYWDLMHNLATDGRTILFATHYLQEAQDFADQVVILQDGRVIEQGTPDDIRRHSHATLRALLDSDCDAEGLLNALKEFLGSADQSVRDVEVINQEPRELVITGADLDAALRIVTRYPGTYRYQLSLASLDQAFSNLTLETEER